MNIFMIMVKYIISKGVIGLLLCQVDGVQEAGIVVCDIFIYILEEKLFLIVKFI